MGKKIKGRELLEACYIRKFLFDNPRAYRAYVEELEEKCIPYEIIESYWQEDGRVIVTIETAYNDVPLIHFI